MERTGQVTPVAFNVDRCVELHNAIIRVSSHAPGHEPLPLAKYLEHWETIDGGRQWIEKANEFMHEPMLDFLSRCDIITSDQQDMTPFVCGLAALFEMLSDDLLMGWDDNMCIWLYRSWYMEDDSIGVVFDLETNKATWIDYMYAEPPDYMEHIWAPLEDILEAWLFYIVDRKRCVPRVNGRLFAGGGNCGSGWQLIYNPPKDLEETLDVWNQYVELVESRLPESSVKVDTKPRPGLGESFNGFAREFFSRARIPSFKYVAPELVYPTPSQMSALANHQKEILRANDVDVNDPESRTVPTVLFPLGEEIHAGLCNTDNAAWQDGVGLVLPLSEGYENWTQTIATSPPYLERVWQCEPKESPYWRIHPARLATVLRKWIELVQTGVWSVGQEGIEGTLNEFLGVEYLVNAYGDMEPWPAGMFLDGVDAL